MAGKFSENPIRLQVLSYVRDLYTDASEATYGLKFGEVGIGPLDDTDFRKRTAIGIVPGVEDKGDLFPLKDNTLSVAIEFRIAVQMADGEDPGIYAERMLGVVQQIMYDDDNFGGLIMFHSETGNSVEMDTYSDKNVVGVVNFDIRYRHAHNNVYDPDPTV